MDSVHSTTTINTYVHNSLHYKYLCKKMDSKQGIDANNKNISDISTWGLGTFVTLNTHAQLSTYFRQHRLLPDGCVELSKLLLVAKEVIIDYRNS